MGQKVIDEDPLCECCDTLHINIELKSIDDQTYSLNSQKFESTIIAASPTRFREIFHLIIIIGEPICSLMQCDLEDFFPSSFPLSSSLALLSRSEMVFCVSVSWDTARLSNVEALDKVEKRGCFWLKSKVFLHFRHSQRPLLAQYCDMCAFLRRLIFLHILSLQLFLCLSHFLHRSPNGRNVVVRAHTTSSSTHFRQNIW